MLTRVVVSETRSTAFLSHGCFSTLSFTTRPAALPAFLPVLASRLVCSLSRIFVPACFRPAAVLRATTGPCGEHAEDDLPRLQQLHARLHRAAGLLDPLLHRRVAIIVFTPGGGRLAGHLAYSPNGECGQFPTPSSASGRPVLRHIPGRTPPGYIPGPI